MSDRIVKAQIKKYLKVLTNLAGIFVLGLGFLYFGPIQTITEIWANERVAYAAWMACRYAALFAAVSFIYCFAALLVWDLGYWTYRAIFKKELRQSAQSFSIKYWLCKLWLIFGASCWIYLILGYPILKDMMLGFIE